MMCAIVSTAFTFRLCKVLVGNVIGYIHNTKLWIDTEFTLACVNIYVLMRGCLLVM